MYRNKSVDVHQFAMVPRADIPRASFRMQHTHKLTFDAGYLVPIYVDEVLPGDTFNMNMTAFVRMATPIFPIMDNLYFETFFFYVPARLVWTNFKKFMGEQANPGDSISYTVPQAQMTTGGYAVGTLQDYMGLPTSGQIPGGSTTQHNALPLRAYNLIWNEWFRDQNLQNSIAVDLGDGPDSPTNYVLRRRGKRHDYFTSALPFLQKGTAVTLPLGTVAPVKGIGVISTNAQVPGGVVSARETAPLGTPSYTNNFATATAAGLVVNISGSTAGTATPQIFADLSQATAATINQLRQSFQIQKLLERDARGGTRYTEIVRAHFGVVSPDARLQRPEYLGGGSAPINITPVAQTSGTGGTGQTTALATLSAIGQTVSRNGFTQSFTEHGYIIGLGNVRADLTYQQGIRRMWSRSTRYDFYFPAFAALGEQPIYNREIYVRGDANDGLVFGYQERWAEYRYHPSRISGVFRSTAGGTLDAWHLAQNFTGLPTLNSTFIEDLPPIQRVIAIPSAVAQQFYADIFFDCKAARPMPLYSVPGLIDHF